MLYSALFYMSSQKYTVVESEGNMIIHQYQGGVPLDKGQQLPYRPHNMPHKRMVEKVCVLCFPH